MDYSYIITAGIIGGTMGLIGSLLGFLLTKFRKFSNPNKVVALCCGIFAAPTQTIVRSEIGKTVHEIITPKSLLARSLESAGWNEVISSSEAVKKFKEWDVDVNKGGGILISKGIKRLEYSDLLEWNNVRYKLAELDQSICSGFYTGKLEQARYLEKLKNFDEPLVKNFMKIVTKAAIFELQDHPYPKVSNRQVEIALVALAKSFPDSYERFAKNIQSRDNLNESEACWTYILWSRAVKDLGQKDSESLLRTMVSEL